MARTLVLGGIKSGKSRLAESLASASGKSIVYIATATALDDEMQARINHHRLQRNQDWPVVEEPLLLGEALSNHMSAQHCVLIDCLTLWMTNLLMRDDEEYFSAQRQAFISAFSNATGEVILVSNESGLGVIPLGELTRRYCDEIGLLHQELAATSHNVVMTVAGLPQVLKGEV